MKLLVFLVAFGLAAVAVSGEKMNIKKSTNILNQCNFYSNEQHSSVATLATPRIMQTVSYSVLIPANVVMLSLAWVQVNSVAFPSTEPIIQYINTLACDVVE